MLQHLQPKQPKRLDGIFPASKRSKFVCAESAASVEALPPLPQFLTPKLNACAMNREDGGKDASTSAAPKMSLDQFMAKHTSEDNASFGEILEGINKRRRERYAWVHGGSKGDQVRQ